MGNKKKGWSRSQLRRLTPFTKNQNKLKQLVNEFHILVQ
jgi:hypothetical protein